MLEPKDIEIDGIKFQLSPLKGFTALYLDKKVVTMLAPIIKGFKDLDQEVNIGEAVDGFGEALDRLGEDEYKKFILSLLSTTIVTVPGKPPETFSESVINEVFAGNALVLYQLVFEIMRYNNFTPFALIGKGGGKIQTIDFFKKLTGN